MKDAKLKPGYRRYVVYILTLLSMKWSNRYYNVHAENNQEI